MRTVVAMSGGVDSSVAALMLKEKGHELIGITIKTWPKEECGSEGEKLCCSLEAIQFARSAADDLGIPFYVVDFSEEFAALVKRYFAEEYSRGRTPNPCIYCNSRIKFGYLFQKARELGAERIATGHYARIVETDKGHCLAESFDTRQDQSYFLYDIAKDKLPFIDFPLGDISKNKVRELAFKNNFMSASRRSSQDICFAAGEGGYRKYLAKLDPGAFEPGDILDENGNVLGRHKGIASYTVGQRKGLGIGSSEPLYVLKIDPAKNAIVVGNKMRAMKKKIRVSCLNWLVADRASGSLGYTVRIRYNGNKENARVTPLSDDEAIVEFDDLQFAPTPGQAAVFYNGGIVMGGGWIEEVLDR
ncbi:MAG: tRNA 2-thiouridine(34) synthase MnmA [Candidatus Omnitrophota bacterium]